MTDRGRGGWGGRGGLASRLSNRAPPRQDAKNRLEEYVYNMRDAVGGRLAPHIAADARASFLAQLEQVGPPGVRGP